MISIIIPCYQEKIDHYEISKPFTDLGYDVQIIESTDDLHTGKGFAIKEGLTEATGEHILIMDADRQIPSQEIKSFFKVMDTFGADVVIGNKRHTYSNNNFSLTRKIISNGYNLLIQLLFGLPLRDTQCGFKLFKRDALEKIIDKIISNRYTFDLEVLVALRDNGIRVADAPVFISPQKNKGSLSWNTMIVTFWDTMRVWWRRQKGWYKIKERSTNDKQK